MPGAFLSWIRPRPLRPGDLVGLCAPAGPLQPDRLEAGIAELKALGFDVRVPPGIRERTGFTAGSDKRRLDELIGLLADDAVSAIVCGRGGAGALRLLPGLAEAWRDFPPKAFLGFSDITAVHAFLNARRRVSLHGPMAAIDLAPGGYDRESLLHALSGSGEPYATEAEDLLPLAPGSGEGRLRGGCLSLLAAMAGTPWALRPMGEDTILFLEDREELPYRIDRMLFQLRAAGAFDGVRGVVFGDMKGCAPGLDADYTLEEVILSALSGLNLPVALGLSSGHTAGPQVTLPLGVRSRLDVSDQDAHFAVLEGAVEA